MDSEYYVNITVGTPGQFFTVILDTLSVSLLIPDVKCNRCYSKRKFDSSKSSTYQPTNYSYGANSANGVYGQDFVRFGNTGADQLVIPNAMFAQSLIEVGDGIYDGIMGLNLMGDNNTVDSPIMTAIKAGILDNPVITIVFKHQGIISSNGGVITFGAIDTANCDRNVAYQPLTTPDSFRVSVKGASLGSSQFSGNWEASIDTGTGILLGPSSVVNAFAKEINGSYDSSDGLYGVDCGVKFNMNLTIGTTVYTLTEKEMILNYNKQCFFGLLPHSTDRWILGDPWFTKVCNIFDYGNKRMGFAKAIIT